MGKKTVYYLFYLYFLVMTGILFLRAPVLNGQEIGVIQNDSLGSGDRAVVSGDYVRIRSGPSLEHRILTKVNSGVEVTVLAKGDKLHEIGGAKNYWYQVKLDAQNLEGWIYGEFLKKKEEPRKEAEGNTAEALKPAASLPSQERIELKELGVIEGGSIPMTSGDLDQNGRQELLFLARDKGGRSFVLDGYEQGSSGLNRVYSINTQRAQIQGVEILSTKTLGFPVLATHSVASATQGTALATHSVASARQSTAPTRQVAPIISLYSYDGSRGTLRMVYKLNTPQLALGTLDGESPYFMYMRKNKIMDNDGTLTYTLEAARIESNRGRIVLKERLKYEKPLPIKKLTLFDLNGDGKDEIITEIGGGDRGGGIVILELKEGRIVRLLNSGIPTYNDSPFVSLWGTKVGGRPELVVYSTNPTSVNEANAEFGFILASLNEGTIKVERFYPVNKMLDEVNNGRMIIPYTETGEDAGGLGPHGFPFVIVDSDGASNRVIVKKAVL